MIKKISLKGAQILGIPALLIAVSIFIANSSFLDKNAHELTFGLTFDFLLTIPIVYFLLIRKTEIPKITVLPVLILSMIIASTALPVENQYYLNLFKTWVFPLLELSVLSFVIYNVRKAIKGYQRQKSDAQDFFNTLKKTCYEILPKRFVVPVVTEIAVFYYGFIYWKTRKIAENEFTYHKQSGTTALMIALLVIIGIETYVLHVLLMKWSVIAAWILSFLSIYSGLQLFGFLKSIYKRPIGMDETNVYLRYGIMNEATIPIRDIDTIELSTADCEIDQDTRKLSFLGQLEGHNIIIRLKKQNQMTGLYGMKRDFKTLLLHVDERERFKSTVEKAMETLGS